MMWSSTPRTPFSKRQQPLQTAGPDGEPMRRIAQEARKDGILAAIATDGADVVSLWKEKSYDWMPNALRIHKSAVSFSGEATVFHVGEVVVVASSVDNWTLVLAYLRGHPASKSVRRNMRRTLKDLTQPPPATPPETI